MGAGLEGMIGGRHEAQSGTIIQGVGVPDG